MTEASSRAGYSLDKDAIADMVKNKQRGFIDAYSGAEGICEALGSNSTAGLDTTGDAIERLTKTYGKNYVDQPDLPTYWELILTGCEDNTARTPARAPHFMYTYSGRRFCFLVCQISRRNGYARARFQEILTLNAEK